MHAGNFRLAGWVAVAALVAFIGEIVAFILNEVPDYRGQATAIAAHLLLAVHILLASFAMLQLRRLLTERYDYAASNRLIELLVGGGVLFGAVLIGGQFTTDEMIRATAMIAVGVPLGIVSMLFGYRMLGVNGRLGGLKKPFAIAHIAAPVAFLTVVLAPLGLLLLLTAQGLLAMIFLGRDQGELEFV